MRSALPVAASGSETSLNAADTYTLDYSSVSVAQYDLSYTQSVQNQVIQGDGKILTLDDLKTMIPDNVIRTLRGLYCTAGSGISAVTVGDPTLDLDADDAYDLAGQITLRAGAAALGMPTLTLAPQQWNTLRNAFRSEPAFVQNLQAFQAVQRGGGQLLGDVLGLGFGIQLTDSVVTSGGAYKVESFKPGQEIVYVRNDDWKCGPMPKVRRIVQREVPNAGNRRALLLKGELLRSELGGE